MLRSLTLALAATALLSSCTLFGGPTIHGSGVRASQVRELEDFDRLAIAGAVEVEVRVGGQAGVELEIDDNLLPYVRTEVVGRTLKLEFEDGARYRFEGALEATVTAPALQSLAAAGACSVRVEGIDSPEFDLSVAGSCRASLTGRADDLKVAVAGSGELELVGLQSARAEVSIAGSGDVDVSARDALEVSIAGSGTVNYAGSPEVSRSVLGSGTIAPLQIN